MPPKITKIRWSAKNIPYGLEFNENTGIFTGTPEDAGEYIVPVTIETNYGMDTKNVVINVIPNGCGHVYVIGGNVNNYGFIVKNSVPDEYGFYPAANLPDNVVSLSRYPVGFRAHTTSGEVYGPAMGEFATKNTAGWSSSNSIVDAYGRRYDDNGITYVRKEIYYYGSYKHTFYICAFVRCDLQKKIRILDRYYDFYSNGVTSAGQQSNSVKGSSYYGSVLDIGTYEKGIRWLSADGTQDCRKEYTVDTNGYTANSKILTTNLDYKAIKLISPAPFNFLSENMLLDNNPDNFTHGIIKDAWGYGTLMYVQTIGNQLYEYTTDSGAWNLLGTYDIKKIEVQNNASMLMLTNDGRLFHKGNNIVSRKTQEQEEVIVPQHETLTHIFSSQHFIDFTLSQGEYTWFGRNVLSVLRE